MLDSKAYKEYYYVASRAKPLKAKTKYKKKEDEPVTPSKSKSALAAEEVPDVPKYNLESEEELWTFSQDDEDDVEESDMNDESEETKSDNDGDDLTHPNLSTYKADDEEEEEEKADNNEVSSDQRVYTPPDHQLTDKEENQKGDNEVKEGKEEQEEEEQYRDLNINLQRSDAEMTDAQQENVQANQVTEDTHVTLTTVPPAFDQRVSALETKMSEFKQTSQFADAVSSIPGIVDNYLASKMKEAVDVVDSTMKAIIKEQVQAQVSKIMPKIEKYVTESLGAKVLVLSTNQPRTSYVVAASLLEFKLKKILIDKMEKNKSINRSDIEKDLYNSLVESYNSEKDIISSYGDVVTLKRGRNDQDKDEEPSAGSNRGSQPKSLNKSAPAEEHGGSSSRKHTTSITKTKATDYGQDLKRQKFYGYDSNMETSKDVYSRHKIIAVTSLKIMKEGDFKRLRRQDIKDMLLLLVQKRVEDLHLGVESYQKKINLRCPNTYCSNLTRMTPYTAYPDIQGIIYEEEMKKNRLMRTDELHKFSDGTLNHIRIALNDIATGIKMDYLPKRK
nr:hypothetical protein [Tanacetum cinerariifolium]